MLKKLLVAAVWALLAFPVGQAVAQTGTVAGVVTDSTTGEPLPGVNVVVEGTQLGTATGADGEFSIAGVPVGDQTLVTSFIGYDTEQVPVNVAEGEVTEVSIDLAPQVVGLEDVVVTALGIERQERALGYSVQEVEGEELAQVPETNFINALQGEVAGANFYTSNAMGGSTRIVLRGASSVLGNNEPLIVVDGIAINNSNLTGSLQEQGAGGYDYGNAAQILNPANIASVTVLKGPNAAALYGSRAANGVIQITTKSGANVQGIGVTFNTSIMASRVYGLADYQNEFGGGYFDPFLTLDGDYIQDSPEDHFWVNYGEDESWGPRLDDGRMVRQWYSWDEVNGLLGQPTPWVSHPNNVQDFFETGLTVNSTVSFAQGGEDYNYRTSLANLTQTGIFPNQRMVRNQVNFNGQVDLTSDLGVQVVANYIDADAKGRVQTGYTGFNPFLQFSLFGQRQVDTGQDSYLRDYLREDGAHRGWNWDTLTGAQLGNFRYTGNPYFLLYESFQTDDTERLFGKVRLSYALTDNLSLAGEAGTDFYTERRQQRTDVESVVTGGYLEQIFEVQETQFQARLNWDGQLTQDFSLSTFGATEFRYETLSENTGSTVGGLIAADVYTLENSVGRPAVVDYFEEQGTYSLYGAASLGWRDLLYLDLTARNDWSSTLPEESNSYFYPSVSTSFVFSALPALQGADVLSFGKLRASWARVGSATQPYRLLRTYPVGTPFLGRPVQGLPANLPNQDLLPEITSSWEIGTQLQFFNNRIGLDATYYTESTRNQILPVDVSYATGYATVLLNAGEVTNQGVELTLRGSPVLTESLQWDVTANWATNVSEVVELAEGLQAKTIGLTSAGFGPAVQARVGHPYGVLYGTSFVRDANGNIVLSDAGTPITGPREVLGSYQPDWTANLSSTLSYKGISASVSLNGQKGGSLYSLTNAFGFYSGMLSETVDGNVRALGINPGGVWFPDGEPEDGYESAVGEPFDERIRVDSFFKNSFFVIDEANVYDASYIQLREVRIGYTFPQQWLGNTPIQNLTVSGIGQNLAILYKETPHVNPAYAISASNIQGFETGQIPPQRQYGFSLRMSF